MGAFFGAVIGVLFGVFIEALFGVFIVIVFGGFIGESFCVLIGALFGVFMGELFGVFITFSAFSGETEKSHTSLFVVTHDHKLVHLPKYFCTHIFDIVGMDK